MVAVRDLTTAVADAARTVGGQAGPASALAGWADQLLQARATEKARQDLLIALSDLHVIAAWCCHDSSAPAQSHHHFSQAVDLRYSGRGQLPGFLRLVAPGPAGEGLDDPQPGGPPAATAQRPTRPLAVTPAERAGHDADREPGRSCASWCPRTWRTAFRDPRAHPTADLSLLQ